MPELKLSVIQDNVAERSEAIDISELGEPINNITAEQSDQRPVLT